MHPGSRQVNQGLLGERQQADGCRRPNFVCARCDSTTADSVETERRVGVRAPASHNPTRTTVRVFYRATESSSLIRMLVSAEVDRYMKGMIMTLLTRMQTSKTDKFIYLFTYYLTFAIAINAAGLSPDYLVGVVESIQPGWV